MTITINAKQLRASLPKLVERVRRGARFTVLYPSRRAFQIVPIDDAETPHGTLQADPLYRARRSVNRPMDGFPRITMPSCTANEGPVRRHGGMDGLCRRSGSIARFCLRGTRCGARARRVAGDDGLRNRRNADVHSHAVGLAGRASLVESSRRQFAASMGMGWDGTCGEGSQGVLPFS